MSLIYTVLIRGFFVMAGLAITLVSFADSGSTGLSATTLVQKANESRVAVAMAPLSVNPKLAAAAEAKLSDMATKQYFGHKDAKGNGVWGTIKAMKYKYKHAGENLAKGWSSNEALQAAWLASPTHCANILDPRYTDIGIATREVDFGGSKQTLTVQLFGTTKSAKLKGAKLNAVINKACGI